MILTTDRENDILLIKKAPGALVSPMPHRGIGLFFYHRVERKNQRTMKMRISGEIKHSFVNGPGCRFVVFFQGCPHLCPGCHNPETHDIRGGIDSSTEEVISHICKAKYLDGITLSGGDPFLQPEACKKIAEAAHELGLSVWAYTGWTFEALQSLSPPVRAALSCIDVLVDGPFIEAERDENLLWRGSRNQRLVSVQKSIQLGQCVELSE